MLISYGALAKNRVTDCEQIIETVGKKPIIVLINETSNVAFGVYCCLRLSRYSDQEKKDWAASDVANI